MLPALQLQCIAAARDMEILCCLRDAVVCSHSLQVCFRLQATAPHSNSSMCSAAHPSKRPALQYYALGVPAAGALDVYVAINAPPERLTYLAANTANRDADRLADRVVEAVLLESLIQWQRKAGLVRGPWNPLQRGAAPVAALPAEGLVTLWKAGCSSVGGVEGQVASATALWRCRPNIRSDLEKTL